MAIGNSLIQIAREIRGPRVNISRRHRRLRHVTVVHRALARRCLGPLSPSKLMATLAFLPMSLCQQKYSYTLQGMSITNY
ncbi:hypothetical protein K474DRAFT_1669488 [Panus rudis PR-1116 ss-1]|nr:hypothetical protein K474DRAFT_1669488 [Panus rudis PR-1116 ss-1]